MIAVEINNDGDSHSSLSSCNGDDKEGKEQAVELIGIQEFIECHEVDVHTIEYQLHRHEHRYQVSPGKEAIHADKEEGAAHKQKMKKSYVVHCKFKIQKSKFKKLRYPSVGYAARFLFILSDPEGVKCL